MQKLLACFPKTMPSNYQVKGMTVCDVDSDVPGYSLTADQFEKAKRMEDPNYDWASYERHIKDPLFDHPDFAARQGDFAMTAEWNDLLSQLEPFKRSVV